MLITNDPADGLWAQEPSHSNPVSVKTCHVCRGACFLLYRASEAVLEVAADVPTSWHILVVGGLGMGAAVRVVLSASNGSGWQVSLALKLSIKIITVRPVERLCTQVMGLLIK